ncbi:RloB family protein [Streptacidiphilus sp. P02-A3a]|uniref:RloB family protein n=1 Tax=Streptacidiphilus sp. P02-A3a TaxID=2704468 RepID=UPI0015FB51C1|nr:RloB family protein [Streptacidiphilus sp. P02-A3a]QMU73068.1 RloB domain-containing protein [Streptacidiphilus sp. P02-A3a]
MGRQRGKDDAHRPKGNRSKQDLRKRLLYVYTEGEVTEPEYIDAVLALHCPEPAKRTVEVHHPNASSTGSMRKPLPMIRAAAETVREVERTARKAGLDPAKDWAWPQVWVLFDRDDHKQIPTAFAEAKKAGVNIAYSHPCFEFWRLLHYQNYTSTFAGVCDSAADRLRAQAGSPHREQVGFAQSYGPTFTSVSREQAKHVKAGQLKGQYTAARNFARKINEQHTGPDQNAWDPYTDVWSFVEQALEIEKY